MVIPALTPVRTLIGFDAVVFGAEVGVLFFMGALVLSSRASCGLAGIHSTPRASVLERVVRSAGVGDA